MFFVYLLLLGSGIAVGQTNPVYGAYDRAEALIHSHQWAEGLAVLQPLIESDPDNLKAINLAALALTGEGNIQQADEYLQRALKIDPKFVPALKNLAINEFNLKEFNASQGHLSTALQLSPDDPVANLYLGQILYARHDYPAATRAFDKAGRFVSRDPNLSANLAICRLNTGDLPNAIPLLDSLPPSRLVPESQFVLGAALAKAGLFEQAVPYLNAAVEGQPSSYDASFDLGLVYWNLHRYSLAIDSLTAAVDRGLESAELDALLADAYEGDHRTQQAVDSLRKAIALDPEADDSYLDFASLCIDHQDFAAALKVLNSGLQIHPESSRLLLQRAILHAMQDNFLLAEADFRQVALLSPEENSTYKGLGVLYLEAGNAPQAIQVLRQRLREKPDDPDLLYLLGEALLRAGAHPKDAAYAEAQAAFEKSVKFDPGLCLPRVSLGKMYLEQDRVDEAVAELEQARKNDPREVSTYWQLALAYRRQGQGQKQREALNALKALNDEQRADPREKVRVLKAADSTSADNK